MRSKSDFKAEILRGKVQSGMTFSQKVWALTARISKGKITTYGKIAEALGGKGYRAVGNALNRNPYAPTVPCHRVVGSDGKLTGFASGLPKKPLYGPYTRISASPTTIGDTETDRSVSDPSNRRPGKR